MKTRLNLPKEERQYSLFPEGEHTFQITDYKDWPNSMSISATCEAIEGEGLGQKIFQNVTVDPESNFLWLTKLFLKCIGLPSEGDVEISPDEWIGRKFKGEVKHTTGKDGKTYANIKKLIFDEKLEQPVMGVVAQGTVSDPKDIAWEE